MGHQRGLLYLAACARLGPSKPFGSSPLSSAASNATLTTSYNLRGFLLVIVILYRRGMLEDI
jgi:hypothetical protein